MNCQKGYYVDDPKAPPVEISAPVEPVAVAASAPEESTGIAEDATAEEGVSNQLWKQVWKANKVKSWLSVLL